MQAIANTYLKFVDFTQLVSWSSYDLLVKNLIFAQKYSFVRIGEFLIRYKGQVQIEDGVCKNTNQRSYFIENELELENAWFKPTDKVGICGATSTPSWLMEKVAKAIEELN
ncbi:MAG: hypothetical protein EAZ53_04340 [Bacteroidetes bacterium]|nr:MAG: hypothetical protein EAZ53_04340 [Bacteroidota bacterium]